MGMFDYIDYECVCPVCHNKVDSFQSKHGICELETLKPQEVNNFYSSCKKCGCWLEFTRVCDYSFTRTVYGAAQDGERKRLYDKTKTVKIPNHITGQEPFAKGIEL